MQSVFNTRRLVILSLLIALQIILSRFLSINTWNIRIGFSFLCPLAAGFLFGPVAAAFVGGISDLIGALAFPSGPFFPGFTLTAILMGYIAGFSVYKRTGKQLAVAGLLGILFNQLLLSLMLNTVWISLLYGSSFSKLLATRALQALVAIPLHFVMLLLLVSILSRQDLRLHLTEAGKS